MQNVTSNQSRTYDNVSFFYCFCQKWGHPVKRASCIYLYFYSLV